MAAEDENAEVLDRMAAGGDDLSVSRPIDFNLVFADESSAKAFAAAAEHKAFKTHLERTGCVSELPWDVTAMRDMKPTLAAVTEIEEMLNTLANSFGGRIDGWGCFKVT